MGDESVSYNHYLGSSWLEAVRLQAQRECLRKKIGWTVSPRVTESRPNLTDGYGIKIADVATGTGLIALEFNEIFPKAEIYGLDITSSKFPAPMTVPEGVKFEIYDFFQNPPEKFKNAFDIINISLIVLAFMNGNQDTAIKNIYSMLKPGGWLQWIESPPPYWGPVNPETLELEGAVMEIHTLSRPYLDSEAKGEWTKQLHKYVEAAGFEDVEQYTVPTSKATLQHETRVGMLSTSEIVRLTESFFPPDVQKERVRALNDIAEGIEKRGELWGLYTVVLTARKPA